MKGRAARLIGAMPRSEDSQVSASLRRAGRYRRPARARPGDPEINRDMVEVLENSCRARRVASASYRPDQVKSWDIDVLIGRGVELTGGRELQYIRFNGTLIVRCGRFGLARAGAGD